MRGLLQLFFSWQKKIKILYVAGEPSTKAYSTCLTSLIELTHAVTIFRLPSHAPEVKTIGGILLSVSEAQYINKNFRRKTRCLMNNSQPRELRRYL